MRVARNILITILVVAGLIFGLGAFLSPDNLSGCKTPDSSKRKCHPADAIVVISGGDTNARTDRAIQLYKDGWAPMVVVSGAAADKTGRSNAAAMRARAISKGVPVSAVIEEDRSETTQQNAEEVGGILAEEKFRDIILVTSGYHTRRALLEFKFHSPKTTKVRTSPVKKDLHWDSKTWWLSASGWRMAGSELGKIIILVTGGSK